MVEVRVENLIDADQSALNAEDAVARFFPGRDFLIQVKVTSRAWVA
jgi:hypothetical protein